MPRLKHVLTDPLPERCETPRGRRSKTCCELPPDHMVGKRPGNRPVHVVKHYGRDASGRWQSWSADTPAKRRGGGEVLRTEQEREEQVRKVPCTSCGAKPRWQCTDQVDGRHWLMGVSHTARYLTAVDADLVPPLPGWPWTG